MPAFDERTGDGGGREAGDRPGGGGAARGRRHGPARRRHDDPRGRPGPARPAGAGRDQQPADRPAPGLEPADRPDPDRRLRLSADRRGARARWRSRRCRGSGSARRSWAPGGSWPRGSTTRTSLLVETERQMMACGQEVMIVADHTKFGRLALARLCGLDEVAAPRGRPRPARRVPRDARGGRAWRSTWPRSSRGRTDGPRPTGTAPDELEDRGMSTLAARVARPGRAAWSGRSSGSSSAPGRQRPRPTADGAPAEPGREHLGAALPPDAGRRRRPLRRRATSSRR